MSTVHDLDLMRPTWVDVDRAAFARNVTAVGDSLPAGSRMIAVLKANAYGHGAVEMARLCKSGHVAMIAVALLEEALELRRAGITLPILLLGPVAEPQVVFAADNKVTLGVTGPEGLQAVSNVARHRDIDIHLKLDSGMGRMGCTEGDLPRVAELIRATPRLRVEAIYTHFANSGDPGNPFTEEQSVRFDRMLETLRAAGVEAPLHHRANSAAAARRLVKPGEFVRVGITLLGAEALDNGHSRLEPVLRWRSEIARLKQLPAGHAVGYGMTFHTSRPSRIATIPVGYADGYDRLLSNRGEVLVRGRRVPVVGHVSMDLVTIDVTDIPEAAFGDEVVLLGSQGGETITPEEIAARIGTISYEVFCGISSRVPRIYRDGDSVTIRSRFA